jgi:hypothetical protein
VLGDFNGDAKTDVALFGNVEGASAVVMLLTASASLAEPRLVPVQNGQAVEGQADTYISYVPPGKRRTDPELEEAVLDLRTDALLYAIIEKASVIYYLDHGALREYTASD